MAGFYENITVSAAVPNAAADAEAAKDAAVTAKNEAEAAKDAAEVAKNLAEQHKDTASGYVGTVSGAQSIADANVASTAGDRQAAEDARDLALAYRQAANVSALSAENSANSVSANAATVAGMADDINLVAGLQNTLITVAADLGIHGTMAAIRPHVNQINTVSGITTEVIAVAADAADIGTVATDLTGSNNIGTVAGLAPKINTVAGLSSELTTVHGNNADITTVATSLNAGNIIANVSSNIGNVNNVGNKLAEIEAVKNALSDIAAVENKLTEIDSVSDSITNVDSVAGVISEVQTVAGVSDEVANLSKSTGNMATLVSKLGQTNDLAGAVTDAQNSATSASSSASTATTQATAAAGSATTAATHAANLGSVAYQDLTAIAETKAVSAVDVFVYDTSKDSDGGAWRNRTQGTSWYNEALNTSTRGATKKFPAVAVIVATANDVNIYDADDPSMPLWMYFTTTSWQNMIGEASGITCLTARDGKLFVGHGGSAGYDLNEVDFIKDGAVQYGSSAISTIYNGNIAGRNATLSWSTTSNLNLVSRKVNDVAVTVLPNAPIDPDTGLPVPTIAVATDAVNSDGYNRSGSIIKDDGTVIDVRSFGGNLYHKFTNVDFDDNGTVWWSRDYIYGTGYAVSLNTTIDGEKIQSYGSDFTNTQPSSGVKLINSYETNVPQIKDISAKGKAVAQSVGLNLFQYSNDQENSMVSHITSSYNTGWMNGDIKLATLMDTTAETISAPELVINGDFSSFGSELVSNGDFSTTSDWTFPYGDGSISNGQATVTATTDSNKYIRQDLGNSLVSGRTYAVSFNVVAETGTGLAYVRLGGVDVAPVGSYPQGVETHYITYTGGSPELRFMTYANSGAGFTIDDVSVKEVTGWTGLTNASISINAGKLRLTSNGATDGYVASDYFSTTVGKTYRLSLDFVNETGSYEKVYVQNANGGNIADSVDGLGTDQTVTLTFVATTSTSRVRLKTYNGTSGWDNISVRLAVPDRSVNNNGLNIVGNVTKSAVATGAELVGYGGFGGSNYLEQPYNTDFNFGTGDYCVMAWVKPSNDATQYFLDRQDGANNATGRFNFGIGSNKTTIFHRTDSTLLNFNYSSVTGKWTHYTLLRKSGVVYVYVDGQMIGSASNTVDYSSSFDTRFFNIGSGLSGQHPDRAALLRISATAPTPEQIAKIYRDEKPLFQVGAKCTLSSSDDVKAIAYDEDLSVLHVSNGSGSSAYRDEFVGLQNVVANQLTESSENVSACNGLVVED